MSQKTPKPDADAARLAVPPPEPADYSDEVTPEQLQRLRRCWPQDESAMGPVVHEFRW